MYCLGIDAPTKKGSRSNGPLFDLRVYGEGYKMNTVWPMVDPSVTAPGGEVGSEYSIASSATPPFLAWTPAGLL